MTMPPSSKNTISSPLNESEKRAPDEDNSTFGVSQEAIGDEPRNIILGMLSQVTKGMDLHRIPFPTFVLEPRSLLERITDFMSHPQLILSTPLKECPIERFLDVVRYYLSGWHIQPKGVKKPYNPVLGEYFRCRWKCDDGSQGFYIAEQVSHHPPISAYFYANPDNHLVGMGNFKPKGKFLGNSIMSQMKGNSHIYFTNRPGEEYVLTNPNIYARGIVFGTMLMELGDVATIRCENTGLFAEIDFCVKGYFSGAYNAISGKVCSISTGETLYELSGKWTDIIYLKKPSGSPIVFFDANSCPVNTKIVAPLDKQDSFESRRLWSPLTEALKARDFDKASREKNLIEDQQRALTKVREDENVEWRAKFFRHADDDFWYFVDRRVMLESPSSVYAILQDFLAKHYGFGVVSSGGGDTPISH